MNPPAFFDSNVFAYFILPALIFVARICDVSIGTLRIIFLWKGRRFLAPLLGFFEVLIWLMAIRQIMANLSNVVCYFAYAGGFATGNFVGMYIEEKLAYGAGIIRIISKENAKNLIEYLRQQGYGVTVLDGQGASGRVDVVFTIVPKCDVKKVIEAVNQFNPKAFYTVEDVRSVSEGVFPARNHRFQFLLGSKEADK